MNGHSSGDEALSVVGEQWQRQRHAMEDFFSALCISEHTETMSDVAEARIDSWPTETPIDVGEEMRAIALSNLFEVILGSSLTNDESDEQIETAHGLNLWFKPTSWVLPDWVPTPARRKFRRVSTDMREHARLLPP